MSEPETLSAEQTERALIPSVLTNSFRAVLDAFGDNLIHLSASGSVETTNGTTVIREFGVHRSQSTNQEVSIDYEQLPGEDGPVNPLDKKAREDILDELDAILDTEETTVEPDLAVSSFTIRTVAPELRDVTPAQSQEFDLTFVADAAEAPVQEPTRRLNLGRGLYDQLGFQIRNLNLRSVVETEAKYHEQSSGVYFSWGGPQDIRPRAPEHLAIRVNEYVLPDDFGVLKPYVVTDENVIDVPDEAEDDLYETAMSGEA